MHRRRDTKQVPVKQGKKALPSSRWTKFGFHVLIACATLFVVSVVFTPGVWGGRIGVILGITNVEDSPSSDLPSKSTSAIPTADEYRTLARRNGWSPTDPLRKLEDTIKRLPQVFDMEKEALGKSADSLIQMMHEEIAFITKVLAISKTETFDLTNSLFLCVEAMHQTLYRVMKQRLQLGSPTVISKAQTEQLTRHWLNNPLRELLKLAIQKTKKEGSLDHLRVDLDALDAVTKQDILTKVVQLRLYSLISTFAELGKEPLSMRLETPLLMAVRNGDDLAVALLLQVAAIQESFTPAVESIGCPLTLQHEVQAVARAAEEAAIVGFAPIESRLRQHLKRRHAGGCGIVDNERNVSPFWNQSLELHSVPFPSTPGVNGLRWCNVPKMSLSALLSRDGESNQTVFERDFVRRNRPVLVDVAGSLQQFRSAFSVVIEPDGKKRFKVSSIPYASLFGKTEETVSSAEFSEYLEAMANRTGPYKDLFLELVEADHESDALDGNRWEEAAKQIVDGVTEAARSLRPHDSDGHLPRYFFSAATFSESWVTSGVGLKDDSTMVKSVILPAVRDFFMTFGCERDGQCDFSRSLWTLVSVVSGLGGPSSGHASFRLQAFAGPAFSGAPTHSHSPAFNLAVEGRKFWTLLPPASDMYTVSHPLEYLLPLFSTVGGPSTKETLDKPGDKVGDHLRKSGCEFIQRPGEMLFVPRHVSHSVLNIDSIVYGFALEAEQYLH